MRQPKPISEDEIVRLKHELSLRSDARTLKRALQDVCRHYENSRFFPDAIDIRQLVHSHLDSRDVLVRRWALKTLALIGSPEDTHRIINRLKVEEDHEAVTWGTAALFRNTRGQSVREVARAAGLEVEKPLLLASRLYAGPKWLKEQAEPVTVSLNDDSLTLKWAAFLAGYGRAPDDLFDPKHSNEVFLGQLNQHDVPEIAEYSVWALCERPEFGASQLTIPLENVMRAPENVRKWLYQLMAKSADISR